jgi:S-adenosylmethionine:tRNA ribosyltransferase-isomerase
LRRFQYFQMTATEISNYDYDLPGERIAQYPLNRRDGSKLLIYNKGKISEDHFFNLQKYIPPDSLLVFNNTRVIRARLIFHKDSGARIEIFCLEPLDPFDYAIALGSKEPVEWKCIIGNIKKWKGGILQARINMNNESCVLSAERIRKESDAWRIRFSWDLIKLTFADVIESAGHTPLPPYIKREDEKEDAARYQTIYSLIEGSVAAPTAGLHFTKKVLKSLLQKGISFADLTLHVGAGTFQPVLSDTIENHNMHSERFSITAESVRSVFGNIGKIIAVGTTSVRTLESLYWLGIRLSRNPDTDPDNLSVDQWEPYDNQQETQGPEAIGYLLSWMQRKNLGSIHASTKIIIVPGYQFRVISGMVTNFHLPKSTLLLLVSAWTGDSWKKIYSYAMNHNFRFLSYGDSSLLFK